MANYVEKEIKSGLSAAQYDMLCHYFKVEEHQKIVQKNYYFDTIDKTLQQHKWGLRIRLTEETGELTLKIPIKKKEKLEITDYFSLEEGEQYIKKQQFPRGFVSDKLQSIAVELNQLQQIGYLKNERYDIKTINGIFALDKSYFKNGVSYELEYEYNDNDDAFWELLNNLNIDYTPLPSKMARAIFA